MARRLKKDGSWVRRLIRTGFIRVQPREVGKGSDITEEAYAEFVAMPKPYGWTNPQRRHVLARKVQPASAQLEQGA